MQKKKKTFIISYIRNGTHSEEQERREREREKEMEGIKKRNV